MAIKAGTAYVELVLNDQPYKQRLSENLTSTEATAKGIETSWRALGAKNDATYDAMRRSYENSLTLIKNSTTSTTQDILRAEEAKNAKITAINEQQFGKQTSLIDTLKQNWVAASAAVVAAWMLVNKAVGYMDVGAKALQIESSFKLMAEAAGVNSASMITSMEAATRGTIDASDLMQKANKLMLAGYKPDQIVRFSEVVIAASQFMGVSVGESFERISDSLATRMPKAMVQSGAVTKEQMKIVTEAIAAGASQADLMELAIANLSLMHLKLKGTQDEATMALQRFHAQLEETKEAIGKGLLYILPRLYAEFQWLASGILGLVANFAQFDAAIYKIRGKEEEAAKWTSIANDAWAARNDLVKKATDNMFGLAEVEDKATKQEIKDGENKVAAARRTLEGYKDETAAAKKAAQEKEQATKTILEVIRKAAVETEGISQTAYGKDISRIDSEAEKYRTAKVDEVTIAKFVEGEKALAIAKSNETIRDMRVKSDEESILSNYKRLKEETKAVEKWEEEKVKIYLDAITRQNRSEDEFILANYKRLEDEMKEEQKLHDELKKNATDRIKMESDMYKDIRGYATKAYDAEIDLINDRAKKAKDLGVSEIAIAIWVAEETRKANLKKVALEDDFFAGVKAGFADLEATQYQWGQAGIDTVKALSSAMDSTLGGFFTDVFKGQLKSAEDYFNTFKNSLIASFSQMVAKMATDWLMLEALKAGQAGWSWLTAEEGMWKVPGGKNGEVPVVAHEGEMILPKTVATGVRNYFQTGSFSGAVGAGVGAGAGAYVGGQIGQWVGGYFGKEGGKYGGIIGNVAGAKAGAMAGQSVAAYLAGTNAGVAITGVEAGMTGTEAYGAGIMGGETSAGAVAGAEAGGTGAATASAAGSWFPPAMIALTAVMLASGFYELFTRKAGFTNPFNKFTGNEAKKYAPLDPIGESALEYAGAPFREYYNISGNGKYTDPIFYQTWGPAYESIRRNPYFTVEGALVKWWEHAGRNPTKEEITSDSVWNWYRQNPEYYGGINAARNELYPTYRDPNYGENWMAQFRPPPNYQVGTDYVPETGFAMLHKGERVIPANKNAASNQKIVVHNHFYVDGKEFKGIADKVIVDRNKSGINSTTRVYQ